MHLFGGKYLLEAPLGQGGMGEVFQAEQVEPRRTVAIKMLHPDLYADPEEVARFHGEAAAMRRVRHPNVVQLLEEGRLPDGRLYLVMEWAHGSCLGDLIPDGEGLAPARALALGCQVVDALAEIHAAGVVHGDIKADNVMVERRHGEEHARLIDFGLARVFGRAGDPGHGWGEPPRFELIDGRVAALPKVCGTPEYLAPEVIRGAPLSPASDVYAAGTLLYELLVGRTPFADDNIEKIMARQVGEAPAPPSGLCPSLPPALERVILRALAKRPEDRYANGAGLRAAFAGSLATVRRPAARPLVGLASVPARGRPDPLIDELRGAVGDAMMRRDPADVIRAYLTLAMELMRVRRTDEARAELEEALDVATAGEGPSGGHAPPELWHVLVVLGQIYDGEGRLEQARAHAEWALAQAVRIGSAEGRARAERLLRRLGKSSPAELARAASGTHFLRVS